MTVSKTPGQKIQNLLLSFPEVSEKENFAFIWIPLSPPNFLTLTLELIKHRHAHCRSLNWKWKWQRKSQGDILCSKLVYFSRCKWKQTFSILRRVFPRRELKIPASVHKATDRFVDNSSSGGRRGRRKVQDWLQSVYYLWMNFTLNRVICCCSKPWSFSYSLLNRYNLLFTK